MSKLPWLHYNSKGYCIGPRCGDCTHFTRQRLSPLYDDLEIYDCWSCITLSHQFFNDSVIIGDQLILF